jgi:hypothetical protein
MVDDEPRGSTTPWAAVAALQRRQLGLFSRGQGIAAGASAAAIDGRVRRGRYRVWFPGVYSDAGLPDRWEVAALAATLFVGGEAALARDSAARVHELPMPSDRGELLHVVVRSRSFGALDQLVVHRTRTLPAHHVTEVGPLRVTTPTRTVCDLAATVSVGALRRLVASAARRELTDGTRLRRASVRWVRSPGRGDCVRSWTSCHRWSPSAPASSRPSTSPWHGGTASNRPP